MATRLTSEEMLRLSLRTSLYSWKYEISVMSFLKEVANFSKSSLKPTETHIRTEGGRQLVESKDEQGHIKTEVLVGHNYGFVADYKPDLQVAEVQTGLLMGSQDVAADLDLLKKYKVTHILNVASRVDNLYPDKFTYKSVQILDIPEVDIRNSFDECFQFIDEGRRVDAGTGVVFVHCNAGVSRSASIVIGYLMLKENATFSDAFFKLKGMRPSICPNAGFVQQLKEYELQLCLGN